MSRHPVLWLWVALGGEFFYTLIAPGTGLAGEALDANVFVKGYVVGLPMQVGVVLAAGAYAVTTGFRREALRPKPLYPREAYIPFSGGLFWQYLGRAVLSLAVGTAFTVSTMLLKQQDKPVGIATMLAACPGFWLAIAELRHRKLWRRKWWPAVVALFQLAGIALATHLLRPGGTLLVTFNTEMINVPVIVMVVASVAMAVGIALTKPMKQKEHEAFCRIVGRERQEKLSAVEDHFVSAKLLFTLPLLPMALSVPVLLVSGSVLGFPPPRAEAVLPLALAVFAAVGSSLIPLANANGDPRVNGAAGMAALVFVYAWNFAFQGIVPTLSQYIGLAMAFLGAVVLSFTEKHEEEGGRPPA